MAESNRLHSINTSRILRAIWLNPGISRIKVAELLDLDRSTVTKIMQVILERGLVLTAGKNREQSGVGRRQIHLRINEDIGVVLGIEIQDARLASVVTAIDGTVLYSFASSVPVSGANLAEVIMSIISDARAFIEKQKKILLGIGIGLPGIIDPYTGTVIRSNSLKISLPLSLRSELQKKCSEPVFIENDANCCCWGELAFQTENRNRNFISVLGEFREYVSQGITYYGLAVGIGLVIRERVLHGDHFTSGEFKSILASDGMGQFSFPFSKTELSGNANYVNRAYRELTDNLALLVNCLDFTKIVFSGDLPSHPGSLEQYMKDSISKNWLYNLDRNFLIEFSKDGNNSVCIGAAGLFVEKLFSVPDIADRFQECVGYDLYELCARQKGNG